MPFFIKISYTPSAKHVDATSLLASLRLGLPVLKPCSADPIRTLNLDLANSSPVFPQCTIHHRCFIYQRRAAMASPIGRCACMPRIQVHPSWVVYVPGDRSSRSTTIFVSFLPGDCLQLDSLRKLVMLCSRDDRLIVSVPELFIWSRPRHWPTSHWRFPSGLPCQCSN